MKGIRFFNFNSLGIRLRLTGLYVLLFGIAFIILSISLYRVFIQTHQIEFDASLNNYAVDISEAIDIDFFGNLSVETDAIVEPRKAFPFRQGEAFIQIRTYQGKIIVRSQNLNLHELPFDQDDADAIHKRKSVIKLRTLDGSLLSNITNTPAASSYRLINYVISKPPVPKLILQIAVPMLILEREEKKLIRFFAVTIPLSLLIAMFGGLFLSRRAFDPVRAMIEKAKDITASDLSHRLPIPEVEDEVRQLSLTLNELLDRLENAFNSQERFIADASHQLKTPLSILRGELDLMLAVDRSKEEVREFLKSASQEINHLSRMVEDLLLLARFDAGIDSISLNPIRLDEIVIEAISRLESFSKSRKVKVRLNLEQTVFETQGDADLLRAMFHNLLENAVKYSPENDVVEVHVGEDPENSQFFKITIEDHGPGIPLENLPKIFERFYRAENLKAKVSGVGLGLPIALRIAQAHSGTLEAKSTLSKGTTFSVRIKKF